MIKRVMTLLLLAWLFTLSTQASSQKACTGNPWLDSTFCELNSVKYFGTINVFVEGTDMSNPSSVNEIGLSGGAFAQYLRLRFKNSFANIRYRTDGKSNQTTEAERAEVGILLCTVWTVGKTYPVAFHVQCEIGTRARYPVDKSAVLGITTEKEAAQRVNEAIDGMVTGFAQSFFHARGEL